MDLWTAGAGGACRRWARAAAVVLATAVLGGAFTARAAEPSPPQTIFKDVNVVDVDRGVVLRHRDVEVADGVIRRIGRAGSAGSARGGRRIDGRGKYLIPGLIDLHAHLNERLRAQATAPTLTLSDEDILSSDHLSIFLANGVTTLQLMHGAPEMLALRDRIAAGEAVGPRLVVGSPRIDGLPASDPYVRLAVTPAVGTALVDEMKAAGYDFIKIYDGLNAATYDAIVSRAHAQGLRVDGHLARTLPLSHSLEGGQDHVGHIEEFVTYAPNLDLSDVARLTAEVRRSGLGVTTSLSVFGHVLRLISAPEASLSDPQMAYVDPLIFALWQPGRNPYGAERFRTPRVRARLEKQYDFMRALAVSFARAGVPLAIGTDCNVAGAVPGISVHEELDVLVGAGLTPAEVLRMATRNGAVALGEGGRLGAVAVGAKADLVLLEGDPLADIRQTRSIAGVMVRGRWIARPELAAGVERMQARFRALEARLDLATPRPTASAPP